MLEPLTKEEASTLRKLDASATPVLWQTRDEFVYVGKSPGSASLVASAHSKDVGVDEARANALLIAASRNLLSRLLAQLETQEQALRLCREALLNQQRAHEAVLRELGTVSLLGMHVHGGYRMSQRQNEEALAKITEALGD